MLLEYMETYDKILNVVDVLFYAKNEGKHNLNSRFEFLQLKMFTV